jgi:hypothetical protein
VTQDAVPPGGEFTYRFVAEQAGSYWYHSHQVSNPQVAGGLLGSLVVLPKAGIAQQVDVSAVAHTYGGLRTINGNADDFRVPAEPGQAVRVRVSNTDNGPMKTGTADAPVRLPDWASTRLRERPARDVVVDQRPPLSERPDVYSPGG